MKLTSMIAMIGLLMTLSLSLKKSEYILNIEDFGGVGDGQVCENTGSITSGTNSLTVLKPIFNFKDIGKLITVKGAGATGKSSILSTSILAVKSSTQILLAIEAKNTVKDEAVSFGTDNTPAVLKFNKFAIGINSPIVLNFSKDKIYLLKSPRWTYNIMNLQVNGNGCELRNVATNAWDMTSLTTCANMKTEKKDGGIPINAASFLIKTTNKGSSQLQLDNFNDCSKLNIGEWIAVCSDLITYNGFPPNFRYFEYVKITQTNCISGKITIDRALKFTHSSNAIWSRAFDKSMKFSGRASIIKLEQGSKFGITHKYNDIKFICETQDSSDPVRANGYSLTFNHCSFGSFVPSVAENVVTNNCLQRSKTTEFDKLVTNFTDNGSTWNTISSGSSILNATFNNSKFTAIRGLSCRKIIFNNCIKTGEQLKINFAIGDRAGGTDTLVINGGSFNQPPSYSNLFNQVRKVTLGKDGISYSSGILTIPTTLIFTSFLSILRLDRKINVITNLRGIVRNQDNYGYIKSISSDGDNTNISVIFKNTIKEGETLFISNEPDYVNIKNANISGQLVKHQHYIMVDH